MSEKRKPVNDDKGMPYCESPSAEPFDGQAESCFDLVNMYGTYEVQRTMDTDNVFPRIAQGEAKNDPHAVITKDDVEKMPGYYKGDLRK